LEVGDNFVVMQKKEIMKARVYGLFVAPSHFIR